MPMSRSLARVLAAVLLVGAVAAGAQTVEAGKPCRKHCPTPTTTSTLPAATTTTVPATSTTLPPGTAPPASVPGTWTLVFADEFNGTTLDRTRWADSWFHGGTMNNVRTDPGNVRVADGNLYLRLSSTSVGALVNTNPNDMKYWSPPGATPFTFTYGYAEARIRFPGSGWTIYNWPAWWTNGQNWPADGEHDIAEGLWDLTVNYHSASGAHNQGPVPGPWGGEFHTYGINRQPGRADVYWDGAHVKSYPTDDPGNPHYLILNVGYRDGSGPLAVAAEVAVDWVRVWT